MLQSERPGRVSSAFHRLTGFLSGRNSLGLGGRYTSQGSYGTFPDSDDLEVERGSIGYFISRITNNDQNRPSFARVRDVNLF